MIWWIVAALYLAVGLWGGWLILGIGNKYGPVSFYEELASRGRAIRQEPGVLFFVIGIVFLWIPLVGLIFYKNMRERYEDRRGT